MALIYPIADNLYRIPLPQPMVGFADFIGAWLVTGPRTLLVDVGPSSSIDRLTEALQTLEIRHLDAILLTHIHIDHSGGIGDLAPRFPETPVVCHPSAFKHLAAPEKLWAGSLATLGERANAYGPIAPVAIERLVDAMTYADFEVAAIATPGHAPHHVSYRIGENLFAGEAGGVYQQVGDRRYLRPATPPRFFLETSIESLDRLRDSGARRLCYGHVGAVTDPESMLSAHREQLLRWRDTIAALRPPNEGETDLDGILEQLLNGDPLLAPWKDLSPEEREREAGFLLNSIKGYLGYLSGP